MYIRRLCIAALSILSVLYATAALAQSAPIGDASSVQNQVEGIVNRKAEPLPTGGSVFQNEHVRTGDDSQARLVFLDNTDLGVGPKSEVTLDRFVYNPDRGTGRVQIEASRGVFRFVTGSQDKKDYEVVTPSGTIHVKGTEFQLLVDKGYIIVALESGALTVTTNKSRVVSLDQPGTSLTVHQDGRVEGPTPFSGTITQYANAQFPYFASALPPAIDLATSFTSWTGCYVGAEIGGSAGSGSFDNTYGDSYLVQSGQGLSYSHASNTQHGFAAGGLSGCSYQLGPVVGGGEVEYGYDGQSSSETISGGSYATYGYFCTSLAGSPYTATCIKSLPKTSGPEYTVRQTFNVTGVGRVRATVGYAIVPNLLLYVSGGWTFASTNTSLGGAITTPSTVVLPTCCIKPTEIPTPLSTNPVSASNNKLVNGANVGVGGEYAFTRNLIARVEYIYDRLTPSYNYGFASVNGQQDERQRQ
jgi:opacity protein-like surface antigen